MKKSLLYLCFILLLGGLFILPNPQIQAADPTATPPVSEIIINANTSGYQETGVWATAPLSGYAGGPVRSSNTPGSTATWQFTVPVTGYYSVVMRFPGTSEGCSLVTYTFKGSTYYKDQQYGSASLGSFQLYAGSATVTIAVRSPGLTMADAVVITYRAATPPPPTSPSPCLYMSDYTIEAEGRPNLGCVENGGYITSCDDGDWVNVGPVQFYSCGSAIFEINAAVSEQSAGKIIEIRSGSPTGSLLGSFTLLGSGGGAPGFYQQAMWLRGIPGQTAVSLYAVFKNGMNIADIDYFRIFSTASKTKVHIGPTPSPIVSTPTPDPTVTEPPVITASPTVAVTTQPPATPTPVPPTGGIKVQFYNQSTAATSNQLYLNIKVINNGTSALALSNVKIRYYYTIDGAQTQSFYCDYSPVGSSNIISSFVTMGTAKTGADTYVEIGFTSGAGSLAANGGNTTIQARVAKSNWTNYTQTNDYSFNSTGTTFVDWTKVTGYVSGSLQWGVEP
jgi:hypothetical protein